MNSGLACRWVFCHNSPRFQRIIVKVYVYVQMVFIFDCCFHSRAHTIVAINFVQKTKKENSQGMTKSSIVNLVDLAGR